jgi:hypothetical protein
MNFWKPIALCSIAALVGVVGVNVHGSIQSASAGGACHDQHNMQASLDQLRGARGSLDRAEHNKGDWRVAAVRATDIAIHETVRGCEFADDHK